MDPPIIDRFRGMDGLRRVIEALRQQKILGSSGDIAEKLAHLVQIEQYAAGAAVIKQGDATTDLFFILIGSVSILINGREVNRRHAGQHVGEMAAIDVKALRSASVVATSATVTAKIGEPEFAQIANEYPSIWRALAIELGQRLRERGAGVLARRATPEVFIGSSVEGLEIARAIQTGFQYDPIATKVWTDGIFRASRSTLEDLEKEIHETDFGILVLSADDKIESRGSTRVGPRDNVIFELGLLIGALGRYRTFAVHPRDEDIKVPSDLLGNKPITYSHAGGKDITIAIAPVCNELRELILKIGPR
jgi:CRP/FNR family cyclic AMP-dependent transcriptional regulator